MKNSDERFRILSTGILTYFSIIILLNCNYSSVEAQNSTILSLTGSNFLDVDNSERLQLETFTISSWFKTGKPDYLESGIIVNKGGISDLGGSNMNYGIWITSNELLQGGFETKSGVNVFVTSPKKFNDGNWHHTFLTNDGSFLRLYVDGTEVARTSTANIIPDNTDIEPIRIGANSLGSDNFFTGDVDEILIWEQALTLKEISDFYNFDDVPLKGRILYLPFSAPSPIESIYKYQPFETFDGENKETVNDNEQFRLTNYSLAAWFRLDRIDHDNIGVVLNRGGFGSELAGENLNYGIWLNPAETIEGGFETRFGTNIFVSTPGKYNDGLWHYVVLTYDGKILRLYLDGTEVDNTITSRAIPDISEDQKFVIGADSFLDDKFFKGDLDEIRVWDRAISSEEVVNGFKLNNFNTDGQILYKPYSESPPPPQCPPEQHFDQAQQKCVPDLPPPPATTDTGVLIVVTNVINDNGGNKQATDFTISVSGSPAFPPSFRGATLPSAQIVAINQGPYSISVNDNKDGYTSTFKNECTGFINKGDIKVCAITINDPLVPLPQCPPGQHFDQGQQKCIPDTQPPTDSFIQFNFAAAGDWGCNSNTEKTVKSILSKNTELVLGLGDYSYESTANCWLDKISLINDKTKISIGNHDSDEEVGPEIAEQFLNHFNLDKQYHSFTKGNVLFIAMSTQVSFSKNSDQFNFVKQELEKASNDNKIKWKVVYFHKPVYAASSKHPGLTSFKDVYHPLFDQYKVDLVLSGHNHNYQRTFPLNYNIEDSSRPIIKTNEPINYMDINAPVFITVGTAGVSLHSLGPQAPFNVKQFGKFGHLDFNVQRDTADKLVGTFYDNDGNKLDQFTISKSIASVKSITSLPPKPSINDIELDRFGIKKIYPTKLDGEEWFLNRENLNADPRFEMTGSVREVVKNLDGSWTPVQNEKVRLIVYTHDSKDKFNEGNMSTYNLNELSSIGHWYKENDWLNIEMSGYFKLNSASDLSSGYSLSSRAIDHSSAHGGCGGATPQFNFGFDGNIKAEKEMWHVSLIDSDGFQVKDLVPSIAGKWLGIKAIIYNLPNGDVRQEFWLDKRNNGQFEKVYEFTDKGEFGIEGLNGPEKCGGDWDQRYTWGSPKAVFKWDQAEVSFKNLSVREIIPPVK